MLKTAGVGMGLGLRKLTRAEKLKRGWKFDSRWAGLAPPAPKEGKGKLPRLTGFEETGPEPKTAGSKNVRRRRVLLAKKLRAKSYSDTSRSTAKSVNALTGPATTMHRKRLILQKDETRRIGQAGYKDLGLKRKATQEASRKGRLAKEFAKGPEHNYPPGTKPQSSYSGVFADAKRPKPPKAAPEVKVGPKPSAPKVPKSLSRTKKGLLAVALASALGLGAYGASKAYKSLKRA